MMESRLPKQRKQKITIYMDGETLEKVKKIQDQQKKLGLPISQSMVIQMLVIRALRELYSNI